MSDITEKIEQELEEARAVCDVSGATSAECAAAWDAVEELQAAASHQKSKKKKKRLWNTTATITQMQPSAASTTTNPIGFGWLSNPTLSIYDLRTAIQSSVFVFIGGEGG
jgi:xylose isomerase